MQVSQNVSVLTGWLREYLSSHHAVAMEDLVERSALARSQLLAALHCLLDASEIEVLHPIGTTSAKSDGTARCSFQPGTYFRLVRPDDRAHAWQSRFQVEDIPEAVLSAAATMPVYMQDDAVGWFWLAKRSMLALAVRYHKENCRDHGVMYDDWQPAFASQDRQTVERAPLWGRQYQEA